MRQYYRVQNDAVKVSDGAAIQGSCSGSHRITFTSPAPAACLPVRDCRYPPPALLHARRNVKLLVQPVDFVEDAIAITVTNDIIVYSDVVILAVQAPGP